eukprot:2573544-Amphidinium_carterae.1
MEVFGGEGRTTVILHHLAPRDLPFREGPNFDAVVGWNLNDENDVAEMWKHVKRQRPFVIIMAPPCTGQAGWSRLNKVTASAATKRSQETSNRLGDICGQLAMHQAQHRLHYLVEQPMSSMLYQRVPWQELLAEGSMVLFDQCATGLTDSEGRPVRKRTDMRASHEYLVHELRDMQCQCVQQHGVLQGRETRLAQ